MTDHKSSMTTLDLRQLPYQSPSYRTRQQPDQFFRSRQTWPSANVPLCTSSFYTFFYNLPDNTLPIEVIRQAVESGKLSITCTVSYDTHKKIGKGQWSLSTNKKLYTGSTPVLEESKQRIALLSILGGMKVLAAAQLEIMTNVPLISDHNKALW